MFCTSLRRRKQWAPAVPHLTQHDKLKFRESKLDTHDVNLPLPSSDPGQRYLRFVLLSSDDGDSDFKHERVELLYNQSGGSDAAVVWLLGEGGDASSFAQFQVELMDKFDLILIPLQSVGDLPVTLTKFHRCILQGNASNGQRPPRAHSQAMGPNTGAAQSLLPYCALSPPLGEHSVHLLSDLTISFADLANKANSEFGRAKILEYFGQAEAERIILFWAQEYLL